MKKIVSLFLAAVLCVSMASTAFAATTEFSDVKPTDWFYESVHWAHECGITAGTSKTTFSPHDTCTVAQMATLVWRAMGSPLASGQTASTNQMDTALEWSYRCGYIGWATVKTAYETPCTRASTVIFLRKAYGELLPLKSGVRTASPFADIDYNDAALYDAILWALGYEITAGTSKTTYSPDQIVTRAQMATFLYRAESQTMPDPV